MPHAVFSFLFGATALPMARPRARSRRHDASMSRRSDETAQPTRATDEAAGPSIIRITTAGAIAASASFPLIELTRIGAGDVSHVRYAILATTAVLVLHLRHVVFGLRNERPRAASWTLAALALITLGAAILIGRGWALQFAPLAVSTLIVVRGPAAVGLAGLVALAPVFFLQSGLPLWGATTSALINLPAANVVLAIVWRTATLYVPVRLVSAIRQLEATRRELESRAVQRTRSRVEAELRGGLGRALERIISEGESAGAVAHHDPGAASIQVRHLAADARRALAEARRIVAGYRSASLRADLEAATALLQASGARVHLIVDAGISLDAATERSRGAIRPLVLRTLQDEAKTDYTIHVGRDETGDVQVSVTCERPRSAEVLP